MLQLVEYLELWKPVALHEGAGHVWRRIIAA